MEKKTKNKRNQIEIRLSFNRFILMNIVLKISEIFTDIINVHSISTLNHPAKDKKVLCLTEFLHCFELI